jgi:hypothetical protein
MIETQTNDHTRVEDNEARLHMLARLVAKEITTECLRPILRELVLMAELEREAIRRDGVGRSLLFGLRKAGFHLSLDDRGRLLVGPKRLLTKQWGRFISSFRSALVRELTQGW